jgi:hypothetical protein
VTTPTRTLLDRHYRHVTDIRGELPERTGLVSCAKLKQMLGWRPRYRWQEMAAESEANQYPRQPPAR